MYIHIYETTSIKLVGVAILISHKVNFRPKNTTRDKEDYVMIIQGLVI